MRLVAAVQGSDFFQAETSRLERLLESGKVGANKIGEISKKLSVLSAFLPVESEEELTKAEE